MILADIARERMNLARQRRIVKKQLPAAKPEPTREPAPVPKELLYQQVSTPYGAGKVVQIFAGRVAVVLDNNPKLLAFFDGVGPSEQWRKVIVSGRE